MKKILNFIDNQWIEPVSKSFFENFEPATGLAYSLCADSDERDLALAIVAAEQAFPAWSSSAPQDRASILRKISNLIEQESQVLALAEATDNGKPLSLCQQVDIPRSAKNFSFFADAITQFSAEAHQSTSLIFNFTLRAPLGIVACISPWNLPLYLLTWKIAPALAAGNCVIAKPSEITPQTAAIFGEIVRKSGLPAGVLTILQGTGQKVGAPLVAHPKVKAVSFTGSTATGQTIAKLTAPQFKKLSLEMGGKNPAIVFADCQFERTVREVLKSAYSNQGQICLCSSRIYVEQSLYLKFVAALVEKIGKLKIGDPLLEATQQGALVSQDHFDKVCTSMDIALSEGATILVGGKPIKVSGRCENGWFFEPTLLSGLAVHSRTNQDEIFGPIATIAPFETESEALSLANSTRYGLAASVWTTDINRAHRLAQNIEAGIVWINCWMQRDLRTPFGGIKESGLGREGGNDALRFFTEPKNICIELSEDC